MLKQSKVARLAAGALVLGFVGVASAQVTNYDAFRSQYFN